MPTTRPYKPVITFAPTFDVNKPCTIKFFYTGDAFSFITLHFSEHGSDNTYSRALYDGYETIGNNIYQFDEIFSTLGMSNGKLYDLSMQVGYASPEDLSEESTRVLVYTFSTPTLSFDVPSTIDTSYVNAVLTYSQAEGEGLNSYTITLYNGNGEEIESSGERYNVAPPTYTFKNLRDGATYTLKAVGSTIHGMTVEAETSFSVVYQQSQIYTYLSLDNIPEKGAVKISSNVVAIEGESNPSPPAYITLGERTMVNLTSQDSWVRFNRGFNIKDDFLIQMKCARFLSGQQNKEILSLQNGNNHISVIFRMGRFESTGGANRCYLELQAHNDVTYYTTISNYFNTSGVSYTVYIWIRHYKGAYEIKVLRYL